MKPSQHLNNRGIDILVVEDSPTQAEEIKYVLTNKHYFVRTVVNGKEALLQIKKQKPLIVISDIIMPEMDGYELCSYIKKNEKYCDIPVLLLTSLSDPKDIIRGLECGADNFIIKPFNENYLLSRIDYIVANQYIQERERLEVGVEVFFSGKKYFINSQKRQILDLLISTYETAVKKNEELQKTQIELRELNEGLEKRVEERTSLLKEEIQIRKTAEEKISRLNRVYSLLSNINRIIVRTKNIDELFSEACSVSVNVGQYNMVWIGLVDENNSNIKPVAWNGDANDYIDGLKINIDKKNGELGTVGKAVTEGRFIVCNDIENDESMKPWRSKALKKNFKSVASFPLSNNGNVIGAISFYSQYKNFFDNNEINLLDELSSDISFSIYSIQQEQLKLKAEEELKKSESRLRQIMENVDAVFYMMSPKTGQIIYVNSAYERIWELPISTVKENPNGWLEVVHKDDRNFAETLFEKLNGEAEYRIVLPDGRVKWIWERMFPISDERNEIIYICGMAADITDRKNSTEKIKLLANALESINECVSITDLNDNLTFVNNAFCKIYGYEKENLIGQNISIVRSENNQSEIIKEILPKTFDGGWYGELLNKRMNGEEFPVYLSTSAILNEKGETTALMGISSDITERKRIEDEVRELSIAVEQSPISIIITDLKGDIEYVNPKFTQITGYSFDEVKGKNPRILKSGNTASEDYKSLWSTITSGNIWKGEFLNKKKDGSLFWEAATITPIKNSNGVNINFLAIKEDITDRKKAEEKIIVSESQFRSVWENSFDGMRLCDENGTIINVNSSFCDMVRKTKDELEGQLYIIAYDPEESSDLEIYKNHFRNNSINPKLESEIKLWDKRKIWVELSNSFISIAGQKKMVLSIIRDITNRKNYEKALIESEERYRSFVNSIPDLVFIKDENLNYINVNNAFVKFLNKNNPGEILGLDDSKLLSKVLASQFKEGDLKVLAQKKLLISEEYSEGNCFETIKFPVPLSNDNIGVGGFIRDITDRKSAQEKIIKSEAEFRSVWDNSFDAMRLCNSQGIVLKVNQAFCDLMNKSKKEIEGQPYNIFYEPEIESDPIEKYKNKFINRSINPKMETEIKLFDKRRIWVELTNSFIEIKDQPIMLLSIFRDVSKRKEYETQLVIAKEKAEEMNKLKNNFLANMSHELRTPMIGILGFSETLMAELDNEVHKDMAATINYSGNRLLNTLNLLLDLSKIESNRTDIKNQTLNIGSTVLTLAKSYSNEAEKKGLSFIISILDEKVSAELDNKFFAQIINNLLDNAVKYTHKGDIKIQVDSEIINGNVWAVIKIIDSGIGIPKEKLETIFEEFRQVSEGYSRSYEGTGLGLTITRKLVELMNGKISVESELGIGSTFSVSFKACENNLDFSSKVINNFSNKKIKANMKHKILIVENDKVSLEYLKMILKKYFTVDIVENGQSAIKLCPSNDYSLIFMDIGLGIGMNGMQTALEIRKITGYENKPIVAITAYAMKGDKELFLSSGCSHYLSKPYTKDGLMNLVMSILQEKYAC